MPKKELESRIKPDKWLKDRKKCILNLEDIKHYCHVATTLDKTIEIQAELDSIYSLVEEKLMKFP